MVDAQGLLDSALNGLNGSNAPVIDGGGAATAYIHGQLMAGYSPVFNTTAPSGLPKRLRPPVTGDEALPNIAAAFGTLGVALVVTGMFVALRRRQGEAPAGR